MSENLPSSYTNPDSIDAWRHRRMHLTVKPLLQIYQGATWLTVGDGRYGSDAHFLQQYGVGEVVASSVTDATLKIAQGRGAIRSYRAENAEALTASDGSFDFVFCKEAYHHFARPPIAFYEMLRVARIAVILIEPIEQDRVLNRLKNRFKVWIRKDNSTMFEPVGNFLFRVNLREIHKMMMALGYGILAVKRFNDFYHPALANREFSPRSMATLLTKGGIALQNAFCRVRLLQWGLATIMVFKKELDQSNTTVLNESGFQVVKLPRNPYK